MQSADSIAMPFVQLNEYPLIRQTAYSRSYTHPRCRVDMAYISVLFYDSCLKDTPVGNAIDTLAHQRSMLTEVRVGKFYLSLIVGRAYGTAGTKGKSTVHCFSFRQCPIAAVSNGSTCQQVDTEGPVLFMLLPGFVSNGQHDGFGGTRRSKASQCHNILMLNICRCLLGSNHW